MKSFFPKRKLSCFVVMKMNLFGPFPPVKKGSTYFPQTLVLCSIFLSFEISETPIQRCNFFGLFFFVILCLDHQKSILPSPGPLEINMFCFRTSKNRYVLSQDHYKSIFSVPRPLKINIFCPLTFDNQYFLSLDHKKSMYSDSKPQKINIFCPRTTKNQYFLFLDD